MTPEQLAQIHAQCFSRPRPWSAAEFRDLLKSASVFQCDCPDGFAIGRLAGPEVELLTIAVAPNARRAGTGRKLLHKFETFAKLADAKQAFLEVAEDNAAAIALYQSSGYRMAGYRKNYYASSTGLKVTALVMQRDLTAS
jgi:ribosomal-protein-alanine N-acetyltransferase